MQSNPKCLNEHEEQHYNCFQKALEAGWWHKPIILTLGGRHKEDRHESEASLGYIVLDTGQPR